MVQKLFPPLAAVTGLAVLGASAALSEALATAPPGAAACLGCHAGADSALPSLRGRGAADLESAMTAFRTGAREATVMDRIARGFTEAESKAIAAWLAGAGASR